MLSPPYQKDAQGKPALNAPGCVNRECACCNIAVTLRSRSRALYQLYQDVVRPFDISQAGPAYHLGQWQDDTDAGPF
jgi:hypothetical protein